MARPDKVAAVAELKDELERSNGTVLAHYSGLSVQQLQSLRRSLGETARFRVAKNTLTRLAVREAGLAAELESLLEGPSALTFLKGDPVVAAKALRDFARDHPALVIKGGYIEGRALSPQEIGQLADLESREVLLSKLAGAMKASTQRAASAFNAPLTQAAQLAEALRNKREEAGETA